MAFREIENSRELHNLITTTMKNQKQPFSRSEIVENILENEIFGQFCSREELRKKVEVVINECLSIELIKQDTSKDSVFATIRFVIT